MNKHLLYGYWQGIMFLVKSPSPAAHFMRKEIRGKFNLKAKMEWRKKQQ